MSAVRVGMAMVAVLVAALLGFSRFDPADTTLLSLGLGLASLFAMHGLTRALDLRRIAFPTFWLIIYYASVLVPAQVVAEEFPGQVAREMLFAVNSVMVTVPLGMLLCSLMTGFHADEITRFFDAPLAPPQMTRHGRAVLLLLLGGSAFLTVMYVVEVPVIPLFYLVRNPGAAAELVFLREDSFKLLNSPFLYAYDVLRQAIFPFLACYTLGLWWQTKTRANALYFAAALGCGVFFNALTIAKLPVAVIALVLTIFAYVYRGGRLNVRLVAGGVIVVFAFPLVVLLGLQSGTGTPATALAEALLTRMFVLPAEILYRYFEIYPDISPFLDGNSIGRIAWIKGEPVVDVANVAFQYMFPKGITSGSAPAAFIGYFYSDFGMTGVLLGGLLAGLSLQAVQVLLVRRRKTVAVLAAYAFMYWGFWKINLTALPMTLLSGGVFFVLVTLFLVERGPGILARLVVRDRVQPRRHDA